VGSLILKTYGVKVLLNTVMVIAILGAYKALLNVEVQRYLEESPWAVGVSLFICLALMAPFFWGIVMSAPSLKAQREFEELEKLRGLQFGIFVGRVVLAIVLLHAVVIQFVTLKMALGLIVAIIAIAALAGQFWVRRLYQFIEKNFLKNLTEKERKELVSSEVAKNFLPWDASLGTYDLSAESVLAGQNLRSLSFKEKYGVNVAAVYRGSKRYFAPDGEFVLWPYDKLICFGSEEELQSFHTFLEQEKVAHQSPDALTRQADYRLSSFVVNEASKCKDKTIRDSGIREAYHGMVVGIERGPQRILGPRASFVLHEGDLIWLVSDKKQSQVTV
jgi:CPA2 family monovalent cation:H+ antiporter-2